MGLTMSMSKFLSVLQYVLLALAALVFILFYFGNVVPGTEGTRYEEPVITNTALLFAYVLGGASAILVLVFTILNIFTNKKNAIKTGITVGIFLVIVLVASFMATDSLAGMGAKFEEVSVQTLKRVGTGLITMYLLIGLAIVSIVYSEIARYFK